MTRPITPPKHTGPRTRIFVVGLGMVGIAFIEKILNNDVEGRYKIITCGEEKHLAYNRVGLTHYMEVRDINKMYLNSPEWYQQQDPERFEFHTGELVTSLDTSAKIAHTDSGTEYPYDICVITTGSDAGMPPYCPTDRGKKTKGVFVYRNIADLEKIIAYAEDPSITRATVVGGGLLGLEAAKAVYDLPEIPDVSIINRQGYPLSRQLDAEAGEMVMRRIEDMGVKCLVNVNVKSIITEPIPEAEQSSSGFVETFKGFEFTDGEMLDSDMVIMAVGITPRDDLARTSGIKCHAKGGIEVGDDLMTSAEGVYAMGECASWRGNTYGLIAPGVEMADILAFNLCQTSEALGSFRPRKMNAPDLSTKLKLMGVDVASFGDFFADKAYGREQKPLVEKVRNVTKPDDQPYANVHVPGEPPYPQTSETPEKKTVERKVKVYQPLPDEPIKCLTYKDPFSGTYKKFIYTADGKYLLGGMMVGDVSDFVKLVAITKKKKPLDMAPSEFIVGKKAGGEDDGADLDDDATICSCHNVSKGAVGKCIKDGCDTIGDLKAKTKVGTGCGGCMPLVTNIFNCEMKKAGHVVTNNICPHIPMSRADLFSVVKVKRLTTFTAVMEAVGKDKDSLGCEICKPVIGNLISSTAGINEHIMDPLHHSNQDTNDRFLANIQKGGDTFSVVPRMAAGEVTPEGLIAVGSVAKKYGLYTKITGAQRVDMFGAKKQDLPDIWEELIDAGFESGTAYGKSLRAIKSCIGKNWCRYGLSDSVGLAVQLENRYKGIRSPHKLKGGVSGCVRECAEAQGKDFGLIATDKGWNLYVGGNGGANPRHAQLFMTDVKPTDVVKYLDRYLMLYIRTADKLQRTARWLESFEGGLDKLRKIIVDDELGICEEMDRDMEALVGTFECEWTRVVKEPARRKQFRQFVNTPEHRRNYDIITERDQQRPADYPKEFPPVKMNEIEIDAPDSDWAWQAVCSSEDLIISQEATTSCAVKIGDSQIAIYHIPKKGLFATQQQCPHKRAMVLDHGIIGEDKDRNPYVSCPLHKRNFNLKSGDCLNDSEYSIMTFQAKEEDDQIFLYLPPSTALDAAIGTSKWMVNKVTNDLLKKGGDAAKAIKDKTVQLVGLKDQVNGKVLQGMQQNVSACSQPGLDW